MEKLHRDLLKLLSEDARAPHSRLAVMLGTTEKQVNEAVAELEAAGIIVKYTAVVNAERAGYDYVDALIEVRVTPQKSRGFDVIAEQIYKLDEVKSVYLMSGGYDLAVFVEGRTLREVANFVSERLSALDTVISTATHFILKKYKVEGVILAGDEGSDRIAVHP